jgi:hypothetical protein
MGHGGPPRIRREPFPAVSGTTGFEIALYVDVPMAFAALVE